MRCALTAILLLFATALSAQEPTEPPPEAAAPAPEAAPAVEPAEDVAPADDPDLQPDKPTWKDELQDLSEEGAIGLLLEGGFFMWPILLMGIIATGVMIERYRSLKMLSTDTSELRAEVADLLRSGQPEAAMALCDDQEGPVPAVLSTGIRKFVVLSRLNYDPGQIEEQVVKAMDDYSVHIVAALERHLPVLATVSSVAPMLGFLGTVQGMVVAFRDIVAKMGEENIVSAAAGGIQTALLTTCFGLIIGIPAFIAYNYFTSVINRYVLDVEESATELIETVTLQMALGQKETGDVPAS